VNGISDKMALMFSTIMMYNMLNQVQLKPIQIEITSACISVKFWDWRASVEVEDLWSTVNR